MTRKCPENASNGSASQILAAVLARTEFPGDPREAAFLRDGNRVLYVTTPVDAHPCVAAPVRLIQAIHGAFPDRARALTRGRIHTSSAESSAARGMVKVSAKRMDCGVAPEPSHAILPLELIELSQAEPGPFFERLPDGLAATEGQEAGLGGLELALALSRAMESKTGVPLYESDRPVAALLFSAKGQVLGWAPNQNARNRTQHAEVNLVQGYLARNPAGLPAGATIYVSLKPCKMCAGMIWDGAADIRSLRVVYAIDDPGTLARNTALDRGSDARLKAAHGDATLLELPILTGPLTHLPR